MRILDCRDRDPYCSSMKRQLDSAKASKLHSPESSLGFLLSQLAGTVRERTSTTLAPLGITPRDLGLLLGLNDRPGISQSELALRLRIDRTTMSQLVDALTQAKLINRRVSPQDRRSHRLALTAAGSELLQRAAHLAEQVENEITAGMTSQQVVELRRALAELMEQNS